MLKVMTHSGARFSSAYFMAPKVSVIAAKNGENCKEKAQQRVRIPVISESSTSKSKSTALKQHSHN
jgi:hypothetical protein